MRNKYHSFQDLPRQLKVRVDGIPKKNNDNELWVTRPIPALENLTFIEAINSKDGYRKVCEYLSKVEGYFGP